MRRNLFRFLPPGCPHFSGEFFICDYLTNTVKFSKIPKDSKIAIYVTNGIFTFQQIISDLHNAQSLGIIEHSRFNRT